MMKKIPAGNNTIKGIDVSGYQPVVDWAAYKASGVKFAFVKATEGIHSIDSCFQDHMEKARAAGIIVGAYHFFHQNKDPVAQVELFRKIAGVPKPGDLPHVMDWENMDGLSNEQKNIGLNNALMFLKELEAAISMKPIIYTGPYFFENMSISPSFNSYLLWVSHYGTNAPLVPTSWANWTFWQYSDNQNKGPDLNLFNGSIGDLEKLRV